MMVELVTVMYGWKGRGKSSAAQTLAGQVGEGRGAFYLRSTSGADGSRLSRSATQSDTKKGDDGFVSI